MLPAVQYIEPLADYSVDLQQLLSEYAAQIQPLMQPWLGGSDDGVLARIPVQLRHNLQFNSVYKEHIKFMPYTLTVANHLQRYLNFNSVNYRSIHPNCAYNWHCDRGRVCLHIPLITNEGARFVYEDRAFHLPATGAVYIVNNSHYHTFVNSGYDYRLHLTFEIH